MAQLDLNDPRIDDLISLVKDSFRVRPNHDPVYVDLSGNLGRISAPQHQVIFGRRGSGKSCLLVHFHRRIAPGSRIKSIYIDVDEIKRLGYPDVLIRLVLTIAEQLPGKRRSWFKKLLRRPISQLETLQKDLRQLLDLADTSEITEVAKRGADSKVELKAGSRDMSVGASEGQTSNQARMSKFREKKLDTLERHLQDYKQALSNAVNESEYETAAVIVDDFYLLSRSIQPDVLDYLHRLLRGTELYLKLGTVRHRTSLMRHEAQVIGVELGQDVEEISLDRTFQDVAATQEFLGSMLNSMCEKFAIESAASFISADGMQALTLASGGVPRDYLTTLLEAVPVARNLEQLRVTPQTVYKGASRLSYRTKLNNLREDVAGDAAVIERVFADLATFCLKEERKTAFLISQTEVATHQLEHEIIQQLMDYKLIHVVEPDTSAASGRTGRFEAYTLDFTLFMEPRKRNITLVEFWKTDERHRRMGIREAPHYPLERARSAGLRSPSVDTETALESLEALDAKAAREPQPTMGDSETA